MKNVNIVICLIGVFFLGACGGSDTPAYDSSLPPSNATKTETPVITSGDTLNPGTTKSTSAITTTPVITSTPAGAQQTRPVTAVTQNQPTPVKSSAGSTGLNPAHGEPGHRCEISVGAPLNSAPVATSANQPVKSAPITSTPVIQQQPSAISPKTVSPSIGTGKPNPAHGQPGHDCAIAVGAPLKN